MKLVDLFQHLAHALSGLRHDPILEQVDTPLAVSRVQALSTVGTLHLYGFELASDLPEERWPFEDLPISIVTAADQDPIEGYVVGRHGITLLVQTFEPVTETALPTLVPDAAGFLETAAGRLSTIASKAETYSLGPAERLLPWLDPDLSPSELHARAGSSTSVLTTIWSEDPTARHARLATTAAEQARLNKRLLIICPDHAGADHLTGLLAKTLRAGNLPFKSLLCRYEMALESQAAGMTLTELGFEAQMHQFYAKSRADKAALRCKYERFRELTPILAYKAEKQRDLDEVKNLEWRLLTQISDAQGKIKEIDATLTEYESLPIWKRLALQTVGKNVESLPEYRRIHEQHIDQLMRELEVAQARIAELKPEAAIPKEMRPEYDELKEEITRLGGTKKIREMLAAEEGTNRQAFIQNKRIVVTTAARVLTDPLFGRVRFDALLVEDAPHIPASALVAAAALAREKIVLSGDTRELPTPQDWASPWKLVRKTASVGS
ncbi:hypothetical protein [Candidatus Nitrospira bockiana]